MTPEPTLADQVTAPLTGLRGTFGYEHKKNLEAHGEGAKYENDVASIFVQFDMDPADPEQTVENIRAAAFQAKAAVLEQLGVEFAVDDEGVIRIVKREFTSSTGERPTRERERSVPNEDEPNCPDCGGEMWDNRAKKARGDFSKKAPDFKCKDKSCDGVIWPPKAAA